jgi:hypothetical protein
VTTAWLLALGVGSPAVALLVGRWLAAADASRTMRQHQEALDVLGEITQARAP